MADRLSEIRSRADAATPGPWKSGPHEVLWNGKSGVVDDRGHPIAFCGEGLLADQDRAFIAAAREDVPWLLDEIKRLTRRVEHESREVLRQQARLDAVRTLHPRGKVTYGSETEFFCSECSAPYPCPTLLALDCESTKDGA